MAENIVLPLINAMPSPMEREHFIQATARSLALSPEAVRESLKRVPKYPEAERSTTSVQRTETPSRSSRDMRAEQLVAVVHAYPGTPLADHVKSAYCRITEALDLPAITLPESALFYAEQTFGEEPGEEAADELLHAFEEAVIREAYQEAVANLRRAEASRDAARIEEAQNRCAQLSSRLAAFGK